MSSIPAVVDLVTQSEQPQTVPVQDHPADAALMFERLATDPNASVEKIERLMALWERGEARKSEALFNAAMTAAQKEIRAIATDSYNPSTKSRYASYEALDRILRPIYVNNGFGLSFDTGETSKPDEVRVLCYVTHAGGHKHTYHVDMPADGKGAKGGDVMTKTHATGAAISYGTRYLLKMIFNVAVGEDDDDGNGASGKDEKPETKAPAGYDAWLATIDGVAAEGMRAFSDAWNKSPDNFRRYLAATAPKVQAAMKTKAANAKAKS